MSDDGEFSRREKGHETGVEHTSTFLKRKKRVKKKRSEFWEETARHEQAKSNMSPIKICMEQMDPKR